MTKNLTWAKEAFNRTTILLDNGQVVGQMQREGVFDRDVDAHLNGVHLRFDVTGFIVHSVNIHDLSAGNQIIGHITFSFGKRAELQLATGETYLWKRHNMLMRDWDMIREGDEYTNDQNQEVVSYSLTRQFFVDHGDISVNTDSTTTPQPNADVVVLAGLFIRNYFQRRRRAAVAAS
jgi:hypothetical protein